MKLKITPRIESILSRLGLASLLLLAPIGPARGVVTPAANRAFCTNAAGNNITVEMAREPANPLVNQTVVRLRNNSPVDVDGDGVNDFLTWSGTLISAEWVLTCAHALQGNNGRGGGINAAALECSINDSEQTTGVASFQIHTNWQKEQYLLGNDIALVRLSAPFVGVNTFARLSASPFVTQLGVVVAGYGEQGDGDAGGNGNPDFLAVGVNTLDVIGSGQTTDGFGASYVPFPNTPPSVAFMDFDKWESKAFVCQDPVSGSITSSLPVVLSAFSTMGLENELLSPPVACAGTLQPAGGYFAATVCDFLPGTGDSGGPAFLWPSYPNVPASGYYVTGIPVVYGVASLRNTGVGPSNNAVYGNVAGYTLVQSHLGWIYQIAREIAEQDSDMDGRTDEAEFLAGTDPYRAPLAPATYVPKPLDVLLQNIRILFERAVGVDETEVEFSADLLNADSGRYFDLSLSVDRDGLPVTAVVVDPLLYYPTLSELGMALAEAADTLVVRVANADLAGVRQMILSGQILEVTAFEEQVYSGPTKFIDQPTDEAFEGLTGNGLGQLVLIFTNATDLVTNLLAGDILIGNTAVGAYRPMQPPPTAQFAIPYLSQQIPFEVVSVNYVEGKVHVAGYERELSQILRSGTFLASDENFNGAGRDLLDPPVENTYTNEEKEERAEQALFIADADPGDSRLADLGGMNAIPWHFNDLEITPALRLSGEVLLRSSGLRFQVSFREFALKRASVGIDAGVVASMVIETTGTNNNTSVPLAEKQKELAKIPLPRVPITIAGVPCSIGPTFVLSVGAEANAPGGLSIPLETSVTLGTEIGWADGQTFTTPIKEFVAPHVSDPTVFDAVNASAKAWAEARLEVEITVAGGLASAGPSLAIRAEAAFDVAPFNDPWWSMDVGADLVAAFEMNLLGFNVARVETTEDIATFFHRDAGGPLLQTPMFAAAGVGVSVPVDLGPKSGKDVRWALAFAAPNASANYTKGFVTPLSGGGYFVGGGAAVPSFLGVVSADGVAQWMQTFPTGAKPVDAIQLADGSVIVTGYQGNDWWLARYDTTGARVWIKSYRMQADLRDLAMATSESGDPEFYLAGYQNLILIRESDPLVLKLNKDGNLIWCKVFTLPKDDEVYSIKVLSDGNLLLTGNTDSKVGTDLFIGAGGNGLLMKITPAGDVLWSTAVPGRWGMSFRDSAEGPDGSLYAVGFHGDIVRDYYPSILIGKFSPGGELINHVLIGEDGDWDDDLPNAGDTPYDIATCVVWTGESLVLVGNTGLGDSATAWAASLTDELGVRWFSAFDGPKASTFEDLALTEDGIVAMGWIQNPWPTKFDNRTPAWLVSLPFEGMMRFHPHSGVTTSYLQPRVYLSSAQSDFIGMVEGDFDRVTLVRTASVPFGVSNCVPVVGGNVIAGVATTFVTARLERIEPSIINNYDAWAAYHQLTGSNAVATGDIDMDGVKNLWEFFTGTDPLSVETNAPVGLVIQYDGTTDMVEIGFPRAHAAAGQSFNLQYSVDLLNWLPVTGAALSVTHDTAFEDWATLTLPAPDPNQAFFRLELPNP